MTHGVAAIVPAAGLGRRVGDSLDKLFAGLNGLPLLAHTLRALQASPSVRWIIPVVRADTRSQVERLAARHGITKLHRTCLGGASRAESVARGAAAVPASARWLLVHDGARPCARPELIERTIREARRHGAAVCGLPASLTVKAVDERRQVRLTLDRDQLWFAQTPQAFRRDWFTQALARAGDRLAHYPDDAALVEAAGFPVTMVPGDPLNLKVTTREDLLLAEAILASRNPLQVKRQKEKVKTTIQKSKVSRELLVGTLQF
jgi:2-C-methyl-D-erythritol 4-phosphate cytidylyltransferase